MEEIKFSLALTTYNRANILIEFLKKYESYKDLDEIIIIDDCSEDYNQLKQQQWSSKIKIEQNTRNLGVYLNKITALSKTKNDRVLLFDSDNYFEEECLLNLKRECINDNYNSSIIYCAEKAFPNANYSYLSNLLIDKQNWNNFCDVEACFLNTGNQLYSRKAINLLISNLEEDKTNPFAVDSKYINYILVKNGFKLKCTKNFHYSHPISKDSIYILTQKDSEAFHNNFNWKIRP